MIFIKILLISQTIVKYNWQNPKEKEMEKDKISLEYTNKYAINQFWTKPFILIESHGLSAQRIYAVHPTGALIDRGVIRNRCLEPGV